MSQPFQVIHFHQNHAVDYDCHPHFDAFLMFCHPCPCVYFSWPTNMKFCQDPKRRKQLLLLKVMNLMTQHNRTHLMIVKITGGIDILVQNFLHQESVLPGEINQNEVLLMDLFILKLQLKNRNTTYLTRWILQNKGSQLVSRVELTAMATCNTLCIYYTFLWKDSLKNKNKLTLQ